MTSSYADRYGVSDQSAAVLGVIINQGNDFAEKLQFLTRHELSDGSFTETPMDVSQHLFESKIVDGAGIVVAHFTITKDADTSVVERAISGQVTETMKVGSYTYNIDTLDPDGNRKTRLVGTLEIAPRT